MPLRNEQLTLKATDLNIHLVSSLPAPLMRFIFSPKAQRSSEPQTLYFCNCVPYCVHICRLLHTCPFSTSPLFWNLVRISGDIWLAPLLRLLGCDGLSNRSCFPQPWRFGYCSGVGGSVHQFAYDIFLVRAPLCPPSLPIPWPWLHSVAVCRLDSHQGGT